MRCLYESSISAPCDWFASTFVYIFFPFCLTGAGEIAKRKPKLLTKESLLPFYCVLFTTPSPTHTPRMSPARRLIVMRTWRRMDEFLMLACLRSFHPMRWKNVINITLCSSHHSPSNLINSHFDSWWISFPSPHRFLLRAAAERATKTQSIDYFSPSLRKLCVTSWDDAWRR